MWSLSDRKAHPEEMDATGPQIAEFMHYPCITNVVDFHIENNTDIWIKETPMKRLLQLP